MTSLPLHELVATSADVASTSKRTAKTQALAALFHQVDPAEAHLAVTYLAGSLPQGRVGVGWATLRDLGAQRATVPSLTIADIDLAIDTIATTSGPGSSAARSQLLSDLLHRATPAEADFLMKLLLGELRQGASEGLVVEGLAKAAQVTAKSVRRALMLSGDLGLTARTALAEGASGLAAIRLELMRPLRPMLASTASDVADAIASLGEASVEWKLDGARVQVHKSGTMVRVWTRNLNEVGSRLPTVVEAVRRLPSESLVLDGEVLGLGGDETPTAFQDTMSQFGSSHAPAHGLRAFFFDLLHRDGLDFADEPLSARLAALGETVDDLRIPGRITADPAVASEVLEDALTRGHEGVVVKATNSPYEAGRRGQAWRKVKPVHTLDLVVLAAEWGHGRREGWLSNLHLGAVGDDGSFVMVGKTFKGLTDELLEWQTQRFLSLETRREPHVVHVRPVQVVEIAIDGVQASRRYPGGVALRFARVRRYRDDRDPMGADTIHTVRDLR